MSQFRVTIRRYKAKSRPKASWVVNVYDPRKNIPKRRERRFFTTHGEAETETPRIEAPQRRTSIRGRILLSYL